MQQRNKWAILRRSIRTLLLVLCCWILIHVVVITVDGTRHFEGKADVAVILGNRVYSNGQLSSWLKGRVDAALRLYRQGRVRKIFASGGIGTKEDDYSREGDAMKQYLVSKGVPATDIISDNQGQNTFLTARDYMEWNKKNGYTSVVVVSQFYHISRSKYIFRKLGCKQVYGEPSVVHNWQDVIGTLREVPAFYKYLLLY